MKKITFLLVALIAGAFVMNAVPAKAPMRSSIYDNLPEGYVQAGESSIYYSIAQRSAAGPGNQYGISILGKIGEQYYSSTYSYSDPGAGFLTALQVNGGTPTWLTSAETTTVAGVNLTPSVVGQGDVAARVIYTITNTTNEPVTLNVGTWADVYIGRNDYAPISRLNDGNGNTYALDLKESTAEDSPLLCVLFGEGITGVTAADDYWFGYYRTNNTPNHVVGNYSSETLDNWGDYSQYYMLENGQYDSAMGFCWKNRVVEAGETIELSFLISVGNIDFDDPVIPDDPQPGEDRFTYNVEAYNIEAWNDLSVAHPAHIWGYYEHPYGQQAYIEYQVDGGEWIRIETPLTSGENYDLPFDMMFDQDETTTHVLNLRFTLGLGDYAELEGLSWIDVRSYEVSGNTAVYNGQPQSFVVTVNGEASTFNTDYVVPGEYPSGYTVYGAFADNTIGVNPIMLFIDKAPCVYDVELPFPSIEYDGDAHAATVTVPEGSGDVTIVYENTATGEKTTEAPTEVGIYDVYVTITEGDYYYGIPETSVGQFEIYATETSVEEITVGTNDNGAWYTIDGRRVAAPAERGIYIHNGKKYIVK